MEYQEIMDRLKSMFSEGNRKGMTRFGINIEKAYGVPIPFIRKMARRIEKNHTLAQELWSSGVHEARILAGLVDEVDKVTEKQMDEWVKDFDSWDLCDQVCSNLFDKTPFAYKKVIEWSSEKKEFIKRAGFVLIACLAVHDKSADDKTFEQFFSIIKRDAYDKRNFVKKAVNWALRQIGKRSITLNHKAISLSNEIEELDSEAAKWIAKNALSELKSEKIQMRLKEYKSKNLKIL